MVKTTQNSWLGGQLDDELAGRQDVQKYRAGASRLVNFIPVRRGSIRKRPGTDLLQDVTDLIDGARNFRLVPFGYEATDGFAILLCDKSAWAVCSGREPIRVTGSVPYLADELDDLNYVQSNDVLFLAHVNHPPARILHDIDASGAHVFKFGPCPVNMDVKKPSVTSATISRNAMDIKYRGGEFTEKYAATVIQEIDGERFESGLSATFSGGNPSIEEDNDGEKKLHMATFSGTSYYLPWTESQVIKVSVKTPNVNGLKKIRLYKDAGGTFGLIAEEKATKGNTTYTIQDSNISPDTSVSPMEDKKVFAKAGDYPGCVALYQQRLVWAGTKNDPSRIWMSAAGDFYENRPHESLQLDDPIDFILPILQFARINFILELGKLIAFADSCELVIGSDSSTSGVTYETIMSTVQSYIGSKRRLPPIVANNTILFCERTGLAVRNYGYDVASNLYGGEDVSVFSSAIFEEQPIIDWTYQQFPNSTIWCVLADGRMAALTFMKDQKVCAWSVHELGGGGRARAIAKTCALNGARGAAATTSEILLVVERGGRFTLERMRAWAQSADAAENAVVMDAVARGDRRADGKTYVAEADVSGYPFAAEMTTVRPILGDAVGNAQFDVKNVQYAHLRTLGSVGGEVFAVGMENQPTVLENAAPPVPASGVVRLPGIVDERALLAGSNNRDGRITVRQDAPWPFQLLLLEQDFEVEEGGEQ